jgi:predicted transcriptional regulator
VVFQNYTDSIVALAERLRKELGKDAVGMIYGEQSMKERLQDIADFQADKKIVIVANILAGGQCINLHNLLGKRSRSGIINPSYSAVAVLQSAGRIDRAYAQGDVFQRFLLAARTIEEHVARRFHDRNRFITALNDGTLSDADLIPTDLLAGYARGLTHLIK